MDDIERLKRWRLILGEESEQSFNSCCGCSMPALDNQQRMLDEALAAIYGSPRGQFGSGSGRGAGKNPPSPVVSRWLGDLRKLFEKELVTVVQGDAIERCGLKQLLLEPEVLENLEPDMSLAATIMVLKDQIPESSKANAREFIRKIVEQINKLLEQDIRSAVTASLNRRQHSPIPSATALDFKYTIRRNMKNYNPELKTIIPDKYYFFDRASVSAAKKWTVIVDIDQSGSMGESVIYSSVMSAILASMSAIKTHVVSFDTEIIDLSEKCSDPVDMLFGIQLGGGTDINKSVAYCEKFIDNPKKTLFFLITDLDEGGNRAQLLKRLEDMKAGGVTVICLLAIADGGKPYYDQNMAKTVSGFGIPCFACNPMQLPMLLAKAFKGEDLSALKDEFEKRNGRK